MAPSPSLSPSASASPSARWTTGLCGCSEDCAICWCTLFCPCVQIGRNIEIITDGGQDCCTAGCLWYIVTLSTGGLLSCVYTCTFRGQLRRKYALPEAPCNDFLLHVFCAACAICQEGRELKNRGWDPALGYPGNIVQFQDLSRPPPSMEMCKM